MCLCFGGFALVAFGVPDGAWWARAGEALFVFGVFNDDLVAWALTASFGFDADREVCAADIECGGGAVVEEEAVLKALVALEAKLILAFGQIDGATGWDAALFLEALDQDAIVALFVFVA